MNSMRPRAAGARVALSKPIDPWELLKAILEVAPDNVTPS